MQLVKFKREQEEHRSHINRIRNQTPMLDSSTPESLGLKHLAYRPKKMQLIEDQRQRVAKENAKLMHGMTKIMNDKRPQPKYAPPPSLNEVERKREVDRVNFENKLMLQRLHRVQPTLSVTKLENDFKKHLKAEANLRRRQMKPMGLPKDMLRAQEQSSLFDSATYAAQHDNYGTSTSGIDAGLDSPIKSMKEFRQHVIASKKQGTGRQVVNPKQNSSGISEQQREDILAAAMRSANMNGGSMHRNEALFELSHNP